MAGAHPALVQIVGPSDGWILQKLARLLAGKLPYAELVDTPNAKGAAKLVYYINYALYQRPSGSIDVGFFTHLDEQHQFLERARAMAFCICQSRKYADWLASQGVQHVTHIAMGYDVYQYRPRLVLGVVGLLDHPRKGRRLVEELRKLPFVEVLTTEGKLTEKELPDFYQRLDYVLIPATVEGGPLCLLEGLAMGKPVIAPADVGMVPEFFDTEHVRTYPAGDAGALVELVQRCYDEKLDKTRLVKQRTWDRWAESHHHVFMQLLRSRGIEPPAPAVGFRFGMIEELDVPFFPHPNPLPEGEGVRGCDVENLEAGIDGVARHLFWGEYADARAKLLEIVKRYPCAQPLRDTTPDESGEFVSRRPLSAASRG
jgi:hypothetical protein